MAQAFQSGARGGGGALKAPTINRCVKSGGPEIDPSKLKRISQATFDEVVQENVEEFEMDEDEALEDAVAQFQGQGVDLSNIVTTLAGRAAAKRTGDALAQLARALAPPAAGAAGGSDAGKEAPTDEANASSGKQGKAGKAGSGGHIAIGTVVVGAGGGASAGAPSAAPAARPTAAPVAFATSARVPGLAPHVLASARAAVEVLRGKRHELAKQPHEAGEAHVQSSPFF